MAGGLFGRPFVLNVKCIVFSLICMALYLYKPSLDNNLILYGSLFTIFVIAYVAMAWYDYYYDCQIDPLKKGDISLTGLFKPEAHLPNKQIKGEEYPIDTNRKHIVIYASHILFICPLLAYLVIKKSNVSPSIYPLLSVVIIFTLLYHGIGLLDAVH